MNVTERWDFHNPVRLHFGPGRLQDLPGVTDGRRVLLVTTPGFARRGLVNYVSELLGSALVHSSADVEPNPELADLEKRAVNARKHGAELIVGIGGGSALDTAKVLGVLLSEGANGLSLRDHVKSGGGSLTGEGIPVIAVPTTAGTGSEVTPFATIWDSSTKRKHSLAGPMMFPRFAILDPKLTVGLPSEITIHTSLDAISQAFEAIWNKNAMPITTAYATQALKIGLPTLQALVGNPKSLELRSRMMEASLLAGLAISHTRTALAHSISYPLTMHLGMPHGLACSFTLPALLQFNSEAEPGLLQQLAASLQHESVASLQAMLLTLMQGLRVAQMLKKYVPSMERLTDLAPEMRNPERAGNNIREGSEADLERILTQSMSILNSPPELGQATVASDANCQ